MDQLHIIWEEVVSALRYELSDLQWSSWILTLKPVSLNLENNTLLLAAPNTLIHRQVKNRFSSMIAQALQVLCDHEITIEIIDPSMPNYYLLMDQHKFEENGQVTINRPLEEEIVEENEDKEKETSGSSSASSIDFVTEQLKKERENREHYRQNNGYHTLNPRYTLSTFVTGPSNDFAVAAAKGVIKNPGKSYNPFFIYGGSGLGKTHLMQAIAHEILESDPTKVVLYITSEKFLNEMIKMIEHGTLEEKEKFRKKYRSIDVLLIDDIQFVAGKKATMEEVFHTFNDLKEANKQIVLTSDKPPRELKNLEDRLVTRFEGGVTADIQTPDFETRVAILNHKLRSEHMTFPSYILELIAENITTNIRELEGALLKIVAFFSYKKVDPMEVLPEQALALAREGLKLEDKKEVVVTIDSVILQITKSYNLSKGDLLSKSRNGEIALARQIAMYLVRSMTNLSFVAIGQAFNRDHSTVMHALTKIEKMMKEDNTFRENIENLKKSLLE